MTAYVRFSRSKHGPLNRWIQDEQLGKIKVVIQAEAAFAQVGRDRARAATLDMIGDTHLARSMYDEAEECYRLAQAIRPKLGDVHGEATQLFRLGVLYCC
ncbi:hypothetical protein FRC04_010614 [Tulasnella sp. 424]|nr:hypothetical protein FRC04_010614 [Tulasnella sp. 424]